MNNKKGKTEKTKEEELLEIFSIRFNERLDKLGLSQKAFALDTDISQGAITRYKNGEMLPNMETLEKIAKKLGVSTQYLLGKSEVPTYTYEDINKKTGLSQTAIEILYKFQHDYFALEKDFDIDITEQRKISTMYKEELHILSEIIENNIDLIHLLHNIKEYKEKKQELQILIKSYKETRNANTYSQILDIIDKRKFLKFKAMETFSYIIEDISKEENKN